MRFLRGSLIFFAGVFSALALSYHLPRTSGRILTSIPPATPEESMPRLMTWKNGVLMQYAEVQSMSHPSDKLRLSPNADTVRLTVAHFDEFDASYDSEAVIGDFSISQLVIALKSLDRPTGPVPHVPGGKPQQYVNRSHWYK